MSTYTREDVAKHCTASDCWIIIDSEVFDVSKFIRFHPGGENSLLNVAGKDATTQFFGLHRREVLVKYRPRYVIGTIAGERPKGFALPLKESPTFNSVPYEEAKAWQGWQSPYYTESHRRHKQVLRKFYDENVIPIAAGLDNKGKDVTKEMNKLLADAGILVTKLGPGPHMRGYKIIGDVPADEFDFFHELIGYEEAARIGCPGFGTGLFGGLGIGLPPVIEFGTSEVSKRVAREVITGEKRIALAISEPTAGSDVANLQTTAVKSPCGQFYIVNGMKKWITGGSSAEYFTTAVRTGKAGMGGLSLLLIERGPGLTTKKIITSYSPAAGTAFVYFKDVKVPVGNLLGKENQGFKCIMRNFNHERWMICASHLGMQRAVLGECFKWANQRKVFGRNLLSQPVIRLKLAMMSAEIESAHHWLENVTYQMCKSAHLPLKEQAALLAGPIALLKYKVTRTGFLVNDNACQIFGGRALTRSGMGQMIERNQRAIKFDAILGGSEEIMADLAMRQAIKQIPKLARL